MFLQPDAAVPTAFIEQVPWEHPTGVAGQSAPCAPHYTGLKCAAVAWYKSTHYATRRAILDAARVRRWQALRKNPLLRLRPGRFDRLCTPPARMVPHERCSRQKEGPSLPMNRFATPTGTKPTQKDTTRRSLATQSPEGNPSWTTPSRSCCFSRFSQYPASPTSISSGRGLSGMSPQRELSPVESSSLALGRLRPPPPSSSSSTVSG